MVLKKYVVLFLSKMKLSTRVRRDILKKRNKTSFKDEIWENLSEDENLSEWIKMKKLNWNTRSEMIGSRENFPII
jgi:hypothetical protein